LLLLVLDPLLKEGLPSTHFLHTVLAACVGELHVWVLWGALAAMLEHNTKLTFTKMRKGKDGVNE
jgi:hypothetical protein